MASGRHYVVQGKKNIQADRVEYAAANMHLNKACRYAAERAGGDPDGRILDDFVERYRAYRSGWRGNPRLAIERGLHETFYAETGFPPLCVDIETAAVCDLACPFCFRQHITTPDKLIREDLFRRVIDQCAELGVPSIKLNWRGEPLLHPKLPEFIDYAKRAGILEVLMNTDAVTLSDEKGRALIEAGLDVIIYSFDGGTKETYERMRPGRFHENRFEGVYENIRRFAELREEMGAAFPRTQIQMILTADTFGEQEAFFGLFSGCVDDVSVKAYTERGGKIVDLEPSVRARVRDFLVARGLPGEAPHWRDIEGNVYVSLKRLPCEQIYQRLMVTYDGRVSMCCYDWGSEYPIGYVDAQAYEEGDRHYDAVMEKVGKGVRGFELMRGVRMPARHSDPPHRPQTLREIWDGPLVNGARRLHIEGRLDEVPICKRCPFKETYQWERVPL